LTITVGDHTFNGPYENPERLSPRAGIYAIHDRRENRYIIIDVGETHDIRDRVSRHERRPCWERESTGTLTYSELLTPNLRQSGRKEIEQQIRERYHVLCGER